MELREFIASVRLKYPSWTVSERQSGASTWIDIVIPNEGGFTIQATPVDGVGLSRRSNEELDFSGHDEVFDDLGAVLQFFDRQHFDPEGI